MLLTTRCLVGHILWTSATPATGSETGGALGWIRASAAAGDFHFYDEHGRRRIFHGSNRARKSPPWYIPEMATGDAVASHMQGLGFTVVRLGFMWSGYNPGPGEFNRTYLDAVRATVDRLARHGVYSLLNVQMDGLSSKFCTYDGAPRWVIDKATPPAHSFPWPFRDCRKLWGDWDLSITTEASVSAYQDIFDNTRGMLDDFAAFWSHAAERFRDVPGVIGYDIMNEPFAGNYFKDPTLLLPGVAGRKNLQGMYDTVAAAIRAHDDRHIIFYEPTTWGMVFSSDLAGSGFQHVPGGEAYRNRSAYSYHYYCHSFLPSYDGRPVLRKVVCDQGIAPLVYEAVQADVNRLGGAAMQTEGMQCSGVQPECEANRNALDERLFSWIDWNFGMEDGAEAASWARTHARAVAGVPLNMSFHPRTKEFRFCFRPERAVRAPTEIFASTRYNYPRGFHVSTSSNVNATVRGDLVFVTPASSGTDGDAACVRISPRAEASEQSGPFPNPSAVLI